MSSYEYDVVIIGSGPGGYVGAIRMAQLGLKTAIIEKNPTFGGTCLNVGCIPSKALLDSSENYHFARHDLSSHGVEVGQVRLDLKRMLERKDKIVKDLTGGIGFLFKKNKVTAFQGMGRISSSHSVSVTNSDGSTQDISTKYIVIASGSVPNTPPGITLDGKDIVSSTEALSLESVPKHLVVIGGGYIGLELGSVWLRLGAQVTVVEYGSRICPTMDQEVSKKLLQVLKKQGMNFVLDAQVSSIEKINKSDLTVHYKGVQDGQTSTLQADKVLVATGRKPYTEGLGLKEIGVKTDARGMIDVDDHFRTSVESVYAIGDVIRGPMLAHKAEEEGVAVAEILATGVGHVNYETVPGVIYTWPEVASVGLTEDALKEKGVAYRKGVFPFTPNGRAKAMGFTEGFAKILADEKTDRVLGVHIMGPRASDMIAEAVMAMEFGASSEDIARAFHAHPTLSEVLREAALAVDQRARQM